MHSHYNNGTKMRETYNNVGKDIYNFVKMGKNDFTKIRIFLQFMACSVILVQPNRMHDKTPLPIKNYQKVKGDMKNGT